MLEYQTVLRKPIITREVNGELVEYLDLSVSSINENTTPGKFTFVVVSDDYVGRPDLISYAVYGTDVYGDIICKINGISNPFELGVGMELYLPALESLQNMFKTGKANLVKNDSDYINNMRNTGFQKTKKQRRTPAEQLVGESNFTIDREKHVIIY